MSCLFTRGGKDEEMISGGGGLYAKKMTGEIIFGRCQYWEMHMNVLYYPKNTETQCRRTEGVEGAPRRATQEMSSNVISDL